MNPDDSPDTNPVIEPVDEPTQTTEEPSAKQPVEQPIMQPTSTPMDPTTPTTEEPTKEPVEQQVMQPTSLPSMNPSLPTAKEPTEEQTEGPVEQPVLQPTPPSGMEEPVEYPVEEPTEKPIQQPFQERAEEPISRLNPPPANQPTQQPDHQPVMPSNSTPTPNSSPVEAPVSTLPYTSTSINPSTQPVQQPVEQPRDQPVMNPDDSPDTNPVIEPVDEPTQTTEEPSAKQPVEQPIMQPTSTPMDPTTPTTEEPTKEPVEQQVMQPTSLPSMNPSLPTAKEPTEEQTEGPVEQPVLQPSSPPSMDLVLPTAKEPTEDPTSRPTATDEPVTNPTTVAPSIQTLKPSTFISISPSGESNAPTENPSENSVHPSFDSSLVCEDELISFKQDGLGIRTDMMSCENEDESILLPREVSLVSQSTREIGLVNIEFDCASIHLSEIVVTLTLHDGHVITGDSIVSILTPSERLLAQENSVELFQDGSGWTSTLHLSEEGKMMVNIMAQVDGEIVTLSHDNELIEICFNCGREVTDHVDPDGFLEYGFRVNAYSDSPFTTNINATRYMHTQLHDLYEDFDSTFINDAVDTCLIIQESDIPTPVSYFGGGNITFNFTDTHEEILEIELFNIQVGATVFVLAGNEITEYLIEPAINQIQNVVINIPEVQVVTIQLQGRGAVCGIKSCLQHGRQPTTRGNLPPSQAFVPTVSPMPSPSDSIQPTDCYDLYGITEADIIDQTGSNEPIPLDAIKIINGQNSIVTIGK